MATEERKPCGEVSIQPDHEIGDVLAEELVHSDVAYGLYKASLELDPEERDALAAKVKWKLDLILLPMMCLVYIFQFLDKQTLNYSNAYGLQSDLGLHGNQYSWVASVTNIGYLVCAYPSNLALQKLPIGKFVAANLMLWGAILMLTTTAQNFAGIMALRFVLGGAEACIGPAWMLLTSIFWTREEQPFRMACWLGCNGLSAIIGAGLSWGLGNATSALKPWQLIFLLVGALSFALGIICALFLPSTPNDCKFFSHKEKMVAVYRVSHNRTGVKHTKILWYQAREAALDPKTHLIALQALCLGILNGSVTNFMSALLKGFGYSSLKALMYQMPSGAIQISVTLAAGIFASKVPNTLCLTIMAGLVPGIAGMVGIATIDLKHQLALTACAWLQSVFGLSIILTWSLVAANIAGHTKRTAVNGVEFVFYAAGNIVGPFLFEAREAPRYLTAIKVLAGIYGACIFFTGLIGIVMLMDNRARDRRERVGAGEVVSGVVGDELGFEDRTDRENKAFRYKL